MAAAARPLLHLLSRKPPHSALTPAQGVITEITGPRSSGRTTLFHANLAAATQAGSLCALIDASNTFQPHPAIRLDRLLWVQCDSDVQHALKAADLVLQSAAFALTVLDLCDVDPSLIPISWWHRLRLAIQNTPASLLVASTTPALRQAAAVHFALTPPEAHWPGTLLHSVDLHIGLRKPVQSAPPLILKAQAV